MDTLVFRGTIEDGKGEYVELHVPGRDEIPQAPEDWPRVLCKGSFNVRIFPTGYPTVFSARGLSHLVASLDSGCFPCCFEIAHHQFGNNRLSPTVTEPKRGSAQVWRALLEANEHRIVCWVLRRYGSTLTDVLELLSEHHLRDKYHLKTSQTAIVTLLLRVEAV